jgi:hypothetical protein
MGQVDELGIVVGARHLGGLSGDFPSLRIA